MSKKSYFSYQLDEINNNVSDYLTLLKINQMYISDLLEMINEKSLDVELIIDELLNQGDVLTQELNNIINLLEVLSSDV